MHSIYCLYFNILFLLVPGVHMTVSNVGRVIGTSLQFLRLPLMLFYQKDVNFS